MPTLEILSGQHTGQTFTFTAEAKVGKDETCEVKLADPGISRFHAKITRNAGGVSIADLGSSNGTYVNFKKRNKGEDAPLADTDIIFFGRTVCKFWLDAPPDRGGGGGGGVPLDLLRATVPIRGLPNEQALSAKVREAEQVEVIRRLRLHECDPATLERLLKAAR